MKRTSTLLLILFLFGFLPRSHAKGPEATGDNDIVLSREGNKTNNTYRIIYFLTESNKISVAQFLKEREQQAKKLTHVIYFPSSIDIDIDENEDIALSSAEMADWQALKDAATIDGFKPMFGFHKNMDIIRRTLQHENSRTLLIQHIIELQQMLKGAGIDFDIEYPSSASDTKLLGVFFNQLRKAMSTNVLLSADVGPKSFTLSPLGHLEGNVINNSLDWVNLMSYGKGQNNGLQMMYSIVAEYARKHVDARKMVIGLPFYAKAYYTDEAGEKKAFIPSYEYLVQHIGADDMYTDSLAFDKPGADPNYLLFNSPSIIEEKAKFARSYGGVMAWHWRDDVVGEHSLTGAIIRGKR